MDAATTPPEPPADSESTWSERLAQFLRTYASADLERAYAAYTPPPGKTMGRSLVLGIDDISRGLGGEDYRGFLHYLINHPTDAIRELEGAIKQWTPASDILATSGSARPKLNARISMRVRERDPTTGEMRVKGVQAHAEIDYPIHQLGSSQYGKLVSVRGVVRKVSERMGNVIVAVFKCKRCQAIIREPQTGEQHLKLNEPMDCYEDQGGCGRESKFKLLTKNEGKGGKSEFLDMQRCVIETLPEEAVGSGEPPKVEVWLEDDLIGTLLPGERVRVTGVLESSSKFHKRHVSTLMDHFLTVRGVDHEEELNEDSTITTEDIQKARELVASPDFIPRLCRTLSGTSVGNEEVALVLGLSMVGGERRPGVEHQIHVVLMGDPGTSKTRLARHALTYAPRYVMTTGGATSKAGLTLSAVKDEDGRWGIEAGAFVKANKGVLLIDEGQQCEDHEKQSLNEGMESQTVSASKAGLVVNYKTDTTVWFVANPKFHHLEDETPLLQQFNIPENTLSRFGAIFLFRDAQNRQKDALVIDSMLSAYADDDEQPASTPDAPTSLPIDRKLLRKLIRIAQDHSVRVPKSIRNLVNERMVELRERGAAARKRAASDDTEILGVSMRHVNAVIRIATAIAKLHLRDAVTPDDVERSITIFKSWAKGSFLGDLGVADGHSVVIQEVQARVFAAIRQLSAGNERGPTTNEVRAAAGDDISEEKLRATLEYMSTHSRIYGDHERGWKPT